ncbi:MAG: IPT/TIG domain-containing protein, partial [Planctomycetota bacterium]
MRRIWVQRTALALGLTGVLTFAATAQKADYGVAPRAGVQEAFELFQAENGPGWRLTYHQETGYGRILWGMNIPSPRLLETDDDFVARALELVDANAGIFGVDSQDLELVSVNHSHLSLAGGTDKIGVELRQHVDGMPVHGTTYVVLFLEDGRAVSLDANVAPMARGLAIRPKLAEVEAQENAVNDFLAEFGMPADEITEPELAIYFTDPNGRREAHLSYLLDVGSNVLNGRGLPTKQGYAIDAMTGEVVDQWNEVHEADILGTVKGWATPGVRPDVANNPETLINLSDITVTLSTGATTTTDSNGNFVFSNQTVNRTVTARLRGPWVRVVNQAGSDAVISATFSPDVSQDLIFNPTMGQFTTSEVNAANWVNQFRNWIKSVDPGVNTMDFQVTATVNINSSCNAYYNGSSINMYRSGGGCVNTGYSTVLAHEEGHWANSRFGTGNGSDGMGEGGADVWAMYLADDPIVGREFSGSSFIRTGNNTRQFCGDGNGGCYGQVHRDGEVIMGALWKVRRNLNTTLGNAAGDAIADALNLGWFVQYNDTQIRSIIETHWLILDDDDGNINNGTPNAGDIDGAFREQGFPGVTFGPPVVNSVNPTSAASFGGTTITLTGSNLQDTSTVSVGGNSVAFQVVNSSTITFDSPFTSSLAPQVIDVANGAGSDNDQSLNFTDNADTDIRGTTFIFKPGGGNWLLGGQSDAIFVVFLGVNGGTTPLGNGVSVPVGNAQLFNTVLLNSAGTGNLNLPGYN